MAELEAGRGPRGPRSRAPAAGRLLRRPLPPWLGGQHPICFLKENQRGSLREPSSCQNWPLLQVRKPVTPDFPADPNDNLVVRRFLESNVALISQAH